jgi:chromosome segregation protein
MACFEKVQGHFKRLFQTLFSGVGELRLSNPADPLTSGLLIEAKHKGDRIVNMDSMSGGEKTLTALAFLFAIQFFNPAPFYVFDEADAALDKENSAKLARLIKEISTQSQFIAITHNDNLINEADQIIGVALDKTKSSVLTLRVPRNRPVAAQ